MDEMQWVGSGPRHDITPLRMEDCIEDNVDG